MAFSVSPAVTIKEIDLTGTTIAQATTIGAYSGKFRWGPAYDIFSVGSEADLLNIVGRPNSDVAVDFFTCSSFLAYTNSLRLVRVVDRTASKNAGDQAAEYFPNDEVYENAVEAGSLTGNKFVGKYVGSLGNSLRISTVIGDEVNDLTGTVAVTNGTRYVSGTGTNFSGEVVAGNNLVVNGVPYPIYAVGTAFSVALTSVTGTFLVGETVTAGAQTAKVAAVVGTTLYVYDRTGALTGSLTGGTSAATATAGTNTSVPQSIILTANFTAPTFSGSAQVEILSNAYRRTLTGTVTLTNGSANVTGSGTSFTTQLNVGDFIIYLGRRFQVKQVISDTSLVLFKKYNLSTAAGVTVTREWEFAGAVAAAPGNNELHIVVVDEEGEITGIAGSTLEVHEGMSTVPGTKAEDGSLIYFVDFLSRRSNYVRWGGDDLGDLNKPENVSLDFGVDSYSTIGNDERIQGYDLFNNADVVDISLIISGEADATLASYLIQDIAEVRADAVAFISPRMADVVNNAGNEVEDTIDFRNSLPSSSYGFLDGNWKYMYDKYNDVYRWVPLNGDIAGLAARTEATNDAWWSFAGLNRGHIKNVAKLAYNPTKPQRDDLYKNKINPVVDFTGDGTVLFGDRTLLAKNSAFGDIGVRRLFIVLEKAIATATKYKLFEFNDIYTRAAFVSETEPFMRDIQSRRGVTDFKVICDETNNTPQVIDSNQFVGTILVKPNRSINFAQLNFVAVRSGVSFEEVAGI